jgi:alanine dehydrogenase
MALFLSENDVKKLLTVAMAMEGVESAHRDLALGQAQDTPRARTVCRKRSCTSCRAHCRPKV